MKNMRYVERIPRLVPQGRVLVHNHVVHEVDTAPGIRGFRAWTQPPDDEALVTCPCGWSGLPHYRVRGLGAARA